MLLIGKPADWQEDFGCYLGGGIEGMHPGLGLADTSRGGPDSRVLSTEPRTQDSTLRSRVEGI